MKIAGAWLTKPCPNGRIDALVNNAGTTKFCALDDLESMQKEDFLNIYATNLVGPYQMIRAVAPHMKKIGKGAVVNIASTAGITGNGSCVAYSASKGALITMTKIPRPRAGTRNPDQCRLSRIHPGGMAPKWHGP